jgi:hypothetical protein
MIDWDGALEKSVRTETDAVADATGMDGGRPDGLVGIRTPRIVVPEMQLDHRRSTFTVSPFVVRSLNADHPDSFVERCSEY